MELLVTGANGFVGRSVVRAALSRGWCVTALVRPGGLKVGNLANSQGGVLRVVQSCVHSLAELLTRKSFDAVVNLVGPGIDSWMTNWQANVEYVRFLTTLLKRSCVGKVVHFSSVAVYDISSRPAGAVIREEHPLAPDSWYGTTKMLGEQFMRRFHRETRVPVVVLRPSWVIGRGSRLLDHYLVRAAKSGVLLWMARRAPLNAIYVEDVAHAALQASMSGGDDFSVYNINSLGDQHFGDFLNALRSELHGPRITLFVPRAVLRILAWKYGSLRILLSRVRFDASKAAQELGFVPQYDLSSMVRDIIRRTREAVLSV